MPAHAAPDTWLAAPAGSVVLLVVLGLAAWGYTRGLRGLWDSVGDRQVVDLRRAAAFGAGLTVWAVALVALEPFADALFSAHMVQHLLLALIGAPLVLLGRPTLVFVHALSDHLRRRLGRWQGRIRRTVPATGVVPAAALGVYVAAWWWWHVPAVYDAAVTDTLLHRLEHVTLVVAALVFWSPVVHPRRTPLWVAPLMLLAAAVAGGLLSALLVFSDAPWYAAHQFSLSRWGLSSLTDQQLAGAIMWVPGGVLYLLAAACCVVRWLRTDEWAARRPPAVTAPPSGSRPGRTGHGS